MYIIFPTGHDGKTIYKKTSVSLVSGGHFYFGLRGQHYFGDQGQSKSESGVTLRWILQPYGGLCGIIQCRL